MDKNSVLLIGSGKTGNVFVDNMLNFDKRYASLMINSAINDMNRLPNFKLCQNYVIPGVDGSGRNRELGQQFIKDRGESILDIISKYNQTKIAVFFCSSDGGTGSGSTPMLMKAFRKLFPLKKSILYAIMPRLSENKDSLTNAISFWNDMIDLKKKKIVDTIYLVDNNKRKTFEEINIEATRKLDMAFSLNIFDISGNIDQNDSTKVNTASGYNFIMELDNKYTKLEDAIDQSIKDSVFMLPSSYDCDYMGAVLSKNGYSTEELRHKFEVYNTDYCGTSDKQNLVVLSGLSIPKDGIELIQMALQDLNERKSNRNKNDENDLYIAIDKINLKETIKNEKKKPTDKVESSSMSSSTLSEILSDNFWDD